MERKKETDTERKRARKERMMVKEKVKGRSVKR